MSTDLRSIRNRLNKLQGQKTASQSLWKPVGGKHQIRIVPLASNKQNPFVEIYMHYLGTKSYVSPKSFGEQDPIADYADILRSHGDKDSWLAAKPFTPKLRTYCPIIVRGKENEGTKFWSFGRTTYIQIMQFMDDPDYGDIVDINTGRDLVIDYTPQKESDTNFAKTTVLAKPSQTPITKDAALLDKILNQQPNIRDLFEVPSFEELKSVLQSFLHPSITQEIPTVSSVTAEANDNDGEEVVAPKKESATDISAKFDALFNQ